MGILGIFLYILDEVLLYNGNQEVKKGNPINKWFEFYHYCRFLVATIVIIWTTLFTEFWKRK